MDYISLFEKHLGPGRRSGNEIAFYCWRCDKDRSGDRHLYMNPLTGYYCCYKCMHDGDGKGKGSATWFARIMGESSSVSAPSTISQFKDEVEYDQKKASRVYTYLHEHLTLLPEDHRSITESRGIKHPEAFGIKSCVGAADLLKTRFTDEYLLASGLFYKRGDQLVAHRSISDGRLIIPYINRSTGHVVFLRSRGEPGSKVKYLSPINSMAGKRIWGYILPKADTLLVTEGEFKAMASVEAGVMTVSLPGMGVSHQTLVETLKEAKHLKRVFICFDTQIDGQAAVDACAKKLALRIVREVGITTYTTHLPLELEISNGRKTDIDGYLFRHTPEEYIQAIRDSAEKIAT